MRFGVTLIITTYNWSDALDWVLGSVARQDSLPHEVIVADDGSSGNTRDIIENWRKELNILHCWQPDDGFRAARVRNLAILKASCDYILMVDGDCLLPRNFVSRHQQLAAEGWMVSGGRHLLSASQTEVLLGGSFDEKRLVFNGFKFRDVPLGFLRDLRPTAWATARTCNLGVWRSDLYRVDGFDESYHGWGKEDSDLVVRLLRTGIRIRSGRFATCINHLHHPKNDKASLSININKFNSVCAADGGSTSPSTSILKSGTF